METPQAEGATPLTQAALDGDLAALQALLKSPTADINEQDEDGDTALHAACAYGHEAVVRWLLNAGARLDLKNEEGDSILHAAVYGGEVSVVEMLVAAGFKGIDDKNEEGRTAAHVAVNLNRMEILLCLVKHGADMNVKTGFHESAVHLAASANNAEMIQYLLKDTGLDVNARNKLDRTPLHDAVEKGSGDAVSELLKCGAEVDAKDYEEETALMKAIDGGQRHLVELLLNAGANVNAVQDEGWMPIHCAACVGDLQTIKLLLDRGASVHSLTKDRRSVLSCAASSGSESAIRFLARERPSDINSADEKGWAPIHYAAAKGDAASLQLLIHLGADTLTFTKTGESPLFISARMGRIHTANVMVGREGQDVNAVELEHGRSTLHAAAQSGNVEVVELLIGLGAVLNAVDKDGVSVLHSAAAAGHAPVTMKLFQAGADAKKTQEGTGWTTFLFAASGGNVELLRLLVEKGEDASAVATDRKTALHVACSKGKREAVRYLLGIGINANALDKYGRTALHYASRAEGSGCVSCILDLGVDVAVNLPDKEGYLPLHLSAAERVLEETVNLLEGGADVHALTNSGETALQLAIFNSHYSNVRPLAEAGADCARVLCSFGSKWTTQCEEKLMVMKAAVDAGEVNAEDEDELREQLQWCLGMRACVLHWEKQHREGVRELLHVPVDVIRLGEVSVSTYIAGAA